MSFTDNTSERSVSPSEDATLERAPGGSSALDDGCDGLGLPEEPAAAQPMPPPAPLERCMVDGVLPLGINSLYQQLFTQGSSTMRKMVEIAVSGRGWGWGCGMGWDGTTNGHAWSCI